MTHTTCTRRVVVKGRVFKCGAPLHVTLLEHDLCVQHHGEALEHLEMVRHRAAVDDEPQPKARTVLDEWMTPAKEGSKA